MAWTEEDKIALLTFKNTIDSDDIKVKEVIKKILLNNRFIIHVLNNQDLEEAEAAPDEYFNVNILPYYLIPTIQTKVDNFICYEVNYDELNRYNNSVKVLQVIFHILCHNGGAIETDTGIARHDLLAALIQDAFNYTNYISGGKLMLVSDVCGTTDSDYIVRTLTFEQTTDNNLVKSRAKTIDGKSRMIPKLANKEIHELAEIKESED